MNMKSKISAPHTRVLLIVIILIASVLRFYKFTEVPPSLSWDEVANGYNAYTIANYGKDEYGKIFPLFFTSFKDDKHPIHIYATAIATKILGLNEFSTRLPAAVFGILNVLLIYYLAKILFKKDIIGIAAASFLAISPYNIHFSRFNHEANFVLLFYMLGLIFFYLSFKKDIILLPVSLLSFIISFLTYHPAKVVVPITIFFLLGFYFKEILRNRVGIIISIFISIVFAFILYFNQPLLGLARVNQTLLNIDEIKKTYLYKLTQNQFLGRLNLIAIQYSWHFSPQFLFIQGDKNPRLSAQKGQFYWFDLPLVVLGLCYLLYNRSKQGILVLVWFLTAPLPSAMVAEAPHVARASFMMGSWHIISALGFYLLLNIVKKPFFKWGIVLVSIIILSLSLLNFLKYYFGEYATRYAIEWQYGMKQIVEYVKDYPQYEQVYMTEVRSQPYIFFLYYLKTPLPEFLGRVYYNNSQSKSYNTVSSFNGYYFGGWDKVESAPNKGVLYILTSYEYSGLRQREKFEVKKLIKYPNGTDAFYLVSGN